VTKSRRLIGDHLVWSDMQLPVEAQCLADNVGRSLGRFVLPYLYFVIGI
jgi:hypothetical protein